MYASTAWVGSQWTYLNLGYNNLSPTNKEQEHMIAELKMRLKHYEEGERVVSKYFGYTDLKYLYYQQQNPSEPPTIGPSTIEEPRGRKPLVLPIRPSNHRDPRKKKRRTEEKRQRMEGCDSVRDGGARSSRGVDEYKQKSKVRQDVANPPLKPPKIVAEQVTTRRLSDSSSDSSRSTPPRRRSLTPPSDDDDDRDWHSDGYSDSE